MSRITRNLFALAIQRQAGIPVILVYNNNITDNGDGSFDSTKKQKQTKGFMVDLTESMIQRLNDGGITIEQGAILSLPYELLVAPDKVIYGNGKFNARVVKYTISEGITVMTLDTAPTGYAEVI